jgi:RNA polymerase sigma factor (sigma-70 family)
MYNQNKYVIPVDLSDYEWLADDTARPDEATDVSFLHQALNKLTYIEREALTLAEFSGLSHKEIAEIQESTIVAVKVRIFRAKIKLSKFLGINSKNKEKVITDKINVFEN